MEQQQQQAAMRQFVSPNQSLNQKQIDPIKSTVDLLIDAQNKAKLMSQFETTYFQNDAFNLLANPIANATNANALNETSVFQLQNQWLNNLNDFNRLNTSLANQSLSLLSNSLAQTKLGSMQTNTFLPPGVFGFPTTATTAPATNANNNGSTLGGVNPDLASLNQLQYNSFTNEDQFNLQSQLIDSLKINVKI